MRNVPKKSGGRERTLAFFAREWYNRGMRSEHLRALDEYFCALYSDYVRLSAIEGYVMPDVLYIADDGNVARRDPSCMRLCHQKDCEGVLARFKAGLADTTFTFSFSFPTLRERISGRFRKVTFAKLLPEALRHCGMTAEEAGEKLAIEPRFWQMIVKGRVYPEKNTVLALALVARMQWQDVLNLLAVSGFSFREDEVRDIVVRFLIERSIFNEQMIADCLAEYRLTNLPIRFLKNA